MTKAAQDVLAERERQKSKEGCSEAHDDTHDNGEIARAAACYAIPAHHRITFGISKDLTGVPLLWPWDARWWKPSQQNRRRELVKAGALILAEIERLDRATSKEGQ